MTLSAGARLGPYEVLRLLGTGGMGEVYLAYDARLARRVALKCPSDAWLCTHDARARLQREARAAARLNHTHIAAVYDVLDSDGRPFIVMEYVEGESLASVLARGRPPLERALEIALQLADALAAAHAAGVIHRDLKPGNIMLTPEGQVKVLDFGLARTADPDPAAGPLTSPGEVLGTPAYSAPEQLMGGRADARSDVYSAGAILYELFGGRPPWEHANAAGRLLDALLSPVPDLSTVDPSLPPGLSHIVTRAMAVDPVDRYTSAADLKQALSTVVHAVGELPTVVSAVPRGEPHRRLLRVLTVTGVVLAAVTVGIPLARHFRSTESRGSGRASPPVVAILPLENLTPDPNATYLGAGMAETMSTKLAAVNGIAVVSRSEVHAAVGRGLDTAKLGRALGATYLVTGAIQVIGERLQVTINLISAGDRRILDGAVFQDSQRNLFALQRRIAEELTKEIVGTVSAAAHDRLSRDPARSVDALSEYWRGREFLERPGPGPIEPAIESFARSVSLDAGFALGHAGLGSAYWRKYEQVKEVEWARRATEAAERARQLDPDDPEVRFALARVYNGTGHADKAIAQLKGVLESQPENEAAHRQLGEIHAAAGRIDDAMAEFKAAIALRPDYWGTHRAAGIALWRAGRLDEAEQSFQRVIELQPESPFGYQLLGNVHMSEGNIEAAVRDYQAAVARGGSFATYSSLGFVQYTRGGFAEAAAAFEHAIAIRPNSAVTHWNLADAYRHLGRQRDAAREYRKASDLAAADIGVDPRDATAFAVRATCEARLGNIPRARADIEQAVQVGPAVAEVHYHRALVALIQARTDEALDALQAAVAAGYAPALLKLDRDLGALRSSQKFQALVETGDVPGRAR